MVTSLANFRSDYTIVPIPSGNFLDVREQLYSNINLLRMGCGGRAALTLEEPRSVYHPPVNLTCDKDRAHKSLALQRRD